ncbi:MAG: hypothetical protein JWR21_938 [Herminiimonas sp.]|nr:hypothetical protein [Herminiimonas sp.]
MSEMEIMKKVLSAIGGIINAEPDHDYKTDVASAFLIVGYNLLRSLEDDQFVLGWLESATEDVKTNPVSIALTTAH